MVLQEEEHLDTKRTTPCKDRDTQVEYHVAMEEDYGMVHLQAKEGQGLTASNQR